MDFCKGQKVRYNYDNSVGTITGRRQGDRWQVKFDAATNIFIPATKLEVISETDDMFDALQEGKFQGIDDFRRSVYCHRLSGELTNIIYSMNNSKTDFLPHQFIPVVKFLESYTDRLLIADEVGLGKTIESMYIWEELRVRSNSKRLLIVVPSVLRFKWQTDLKKFFNINAIIVSAQNTNLGKTLLQYIDDSIHRPEEEQFVIIISLESLRISEKIKTSLEEYRDRRKIFDMVIIDEAHNLRNRETKSFKTGELLRDVCENFLLLSATPIQTGSENFYNLLNLLSPEDFYDKNTFDMQLRENTPLVRLANAIDSSEGQNEILEKVEEVLEENIFYKDSDIAEIRNNLSKILASQENIIETVQKLKNKYFYNTFVTRTRKRDVMEDRTQRVAEVISFELADYEKKFYDEVTRFLKTKNTATDDSLNIFKLIARQRQMASCIPAALKGWREDSKNTIKQGNFEEDEFFFQKSFK
ncbi:MAG: DEAD/DEAH box helicase [Treponemataceae bacterium]|nr:DEAD/DEAH box helicase [Treponemataceae bacterium]